MKPEENYQITSEELDRLGVLAKSFNQIWSDIEETMDSINNLQLRCDELKDSLSSARDKENVILNCIAERNEITLDQAKQIVFYQVATRIKN